MTDPGNLDLDHLMARMFESVFRVYIEDGVIPVEDRPAHEIIEDFKRELQRLVDERDLDSTEIHAALDYRGSLVERAQAEASNGDVYIAVTLYATWAEHSLNRLLSVMMTRCGYSDKTISSLLREVRTITKATALWEVVGLPPLDHEHVATLDKAINSRNYFVHYKWGAAPEHEIEARTERLHDTVQAMAKVVEAFHVVELSEIWDGRESELITSYYQSIENQVRDFGAFSDYLKGQTGEPE